MYEGASPVPSTRVIGVGPALAAGAGVLYALVAVALSDLTLTWQVLIVLGILAAAALLWCFEPKSGLLYGFLFFSSIDLTKALVVRGGVYSPGLLLSLADLFLIPLITLWLFERLLVPGGRLQWTRMHTLAAAYTVWLWVTTMHSVEQFTGLLAAIIYTKFFVTFLVLADIVRSARWLRGCLLAVFAGLVVQLLMVTLQVVTASPLEIQGEKLAYTGTRLVYEYAGGLHVFRPSGFLHHPNVLASYLTYVIPMLLVLVLPGTGPLRPAARWGAWLLVFWSGAALVASLSRGGWISLFAAVLFLVWAARRGGLVGRRDITRIALAGVTALVLVVLVFPSALYRLTQGDQRSTEARLVMMDQALQIASSNPIAGVGLGAYSRAAHRNWPQSFANLPEEFRKRLLEGVVHNKYLLTFAENGVVGLALLISLLICAVRLGLRRGFWITPAYHALAVCLAAAVVGQSVFYLFDHFYVDVRSGLLWVLFGLLVGLERAQRNARSGMHA